MQLRLIVVSNTGNSGFSVMLIGGNGPDDFGILLPVSDRRKFCLLYLNHLFPGTTTVLPNDQGQR